MNRSRKPVQFFVSVGAAATIALAAACARTDVGTPPTGEPLSLVRLRGEPYSFMYASGFRESARIVVRDEAQWQVVWAQAFEGSTALPLPAIDFSQEMVVVAALGTRPSGGYGILIEGASERGTDGVSVSIRAISPARECAVTGALTQPVDMARLPRRNGTVRFIEQSTINACEAE